MNKKAIELSFNWLFAILVGAFILFFAIYGTTQLFDTGSILSNTEGVARFTALIDPSEAGIASSSSSPPIQFKTPIRIGFECDSLSSPPFGLETAILSQKINNKWTEKSEAVPIKNKYIFPEPNIETKKLYIFSIPFELGFKVSDLILITSKNYCFYKAPNEISEQIEGLGIENIQFSDDIHNCSGIIVCFASSPRCNISVTSTSSDFSNGYIIKENKKLYYSNTLIYGAIFSEADLYECNVKRLVNRIKELSIIYSEKISIIEKSGCNSNLESELSQLVVLSKNFNSSRDLSGFDYISENIKYKNRGTICKLF